MKQRVVFFEVEGGSDKGPDGHRRDTMPMVDAIKAKGWDADVIYYDEAAADIYDTVVANYDAYIPRVNPGSIPGGEKPFFDLLRRLSDAGVVGMPHPDTMRNFGAKDALTKLTDTDLVPDDTKAYYTVAELNETFPTMLSIGERVLKQNRGSTGEGIWRVAVADQDLEYEKGQPLPLDTRIKCTEAVDNHVEYHALGDFLDFCEQYIVGDNGMLVDMRFMPRIMEGEIRILYVGAEPIFVVHKKPAEDGDAFSATLFSGAKYTYQDPSEYQELVDMFVSAMPMVSKRLGAGDSIPLIWTADFMLDWDDDGNDTFVLGEINCSCVGFTSDLDRGIQEKVANEILRVATAKVG